MLGLLAAAAFVGGSASLFINPTVVVNGSCPGFPFSIDAVTGLGWSNHSQSHRADPPGSMCLSFLPEPQGLPYQPGLPTAAENKFAAAIFLRKPVMHGELSNCEWRTTGVPFPLDALS